MAEKNNIEIKVGKEEWKPISGFEGSYEVSNMGRVRNSSGRILKDGNNGNGYKVISFLKDGKLKKFFIHRLVAEAFIPNPLNKPCVNHIDECKTNNNVDNLEWVTYRENAMHGTSPAKMSKGIRDFWKENPYFKCVPVRCVETGEVYIGFKYAAEATGAPPSNIKKCIVGERHTAGGYHWEFA